MTAAQNVGILPIFHSLGVAVHQNTGDFLRDNEYGITRLVQHGKGMEYHVVLRGGMSRDQERETAAHELGHIVMGHLLRMGMLNESGSRQQEHEADKFASFITPYIWRS